jgi:hypothetical protein
MDKAGAWRRIFGRPDHRTDMINQPDLMNAVFIIIAKTIHDNASCPYVKF